MYKIIDLMDDSFKIEETADAVLKTIEKEWGNDENTNFLKKFLPKMNIGAHFTTEQWAVEKIQNPNPVKIHTNIQFFLDEKEISFEKLQEQLNTCDPMSYITIDKIKDNEIHLTTITPGIYY